MLFEKLVRESTNTRLPWIVFLEVSIFSRIGITKAPVLPVPFLALAITLLPRRFLVKRFKKLDYTIEDNGNTLFLDGRRLFEALFNKTHHEFFSLDKVFKIVTFGGSNVLLRVSREER